MQGRKRFWTSGAGGGLALAAGLVIAVSGFADVAKDKLVSIPLCIVGCTLVIGAAIILAHHDMGQHGP